MSHRRVEIELTESQIIRGPFLETGHTRGETWLYDPVHKKWFLQDRLNGGIAAMLVTIYILLCNEGTPVWRSVEAEHIRDDLYRITGVPPGDSELWEFSTGDVVRCKQKTFSSGKTELIAYEKVTLL